jgi:hypothetical protein
MHALVVYESMFGNTLEVARAVARGLRDDEHDSKIIVAEVGSKPVIGSEIDLLVVGGPTHAFGMTRPSTRDSARGQVGSSRAPSDELSGGLGVREWLDELTASHSRLPCAAFDTRARAPRMPGSAARGIAKRLRAKGYDMADEPKTFWVVGTEGPLLDGEVGRATEWGRTLARANQGHDR